MKIREAYDKLPPDVRRLAFENTPEEKLDNNVPDVATALTGGFNWRETKQGRPFWHRVFVWFKVYANEE